jgi:mono/diheme cytochrome c family protein
MLAELVRASALLPAIATLACSDPAPRAEGDYPITKQELGIAGIAAREPGEAAYARTCIACHGADGKGNGGKTGADLTAQDGPFTKPDAVLIASVRDGKQGTTGVMPAHRALLTDEELAAVVAYARAQLGAGIAPVEPVQAAPDAGSGPAPE